MRGLAERIALLTKKTRVLEREIKALVRTLCPALLSEPGVGAVSAARLLVS
jgi:transposase